MVLWAFFGLSILVYSYNGIMSSSYIVYFSCMAINIFDPTETLKLHSPKYTKPCEPALRLPHEKNIYQCGFNLGQNYSL